MKNTPKYRLTVFCVIRWCLAGCSTPPPTWAVAISPRDWSSFQDDLQGILDAHHVPWMPQSGFVKWPFEPQGPMITAENLLSIWKNAETDRRNGLAWTVAEILTWGPHFHQSVTDTNWSDRWWLDLVDDTEPEIPWIWRGPQVNVGLRLRLGHLFVAPPRQKISVRQQKMIVDKALSNLAGRAKPTAQSRLDGYLVFFENHDAWPNWALWLLAPPVSEGNSSRMILAIEGPRDQAFLPLRDFRDGLGLSAFLTETAQAGESPGRPPTRWFLWNGKTWEVFPVRQEGTSSPVEPLHPELIFSNLPVLAPRTGAISR